MPERTRTPRSAYADNTRAERNRQLRAAKKAAGLVKVEEWVPKDRVNDLREVAAKMREEFCTIEMVVPNGVGKTYWPPE